MNCNILNPVQFPTNLKNLFVQASLLRQHFELSGIWVLVYLKMSLHYPQLVMFE